MKRVISSILILTSAIFAQAQTKSVTLDLLGSSGIAGVSFDSRFKGNHGFGYNVGLSYAYGTGTLSNYSVNGIGIPLEINYLFGQRNSHLVLGLGTTNGIYKYSAKSFIIEYGDDATEIKPEDIVTCSIKLHGTSICIGNVKVKAPKIGGLYAKLFNYLPKWLQFTKEVYDVIYSSRTVIKNSKINSGVTSGFYGTDVWGTYYDLLKGKIPQGYTLYGEIIGYVTGSNTMIQKGFDYKCKPGENKLMIYRISEKVYDEEGHSTNKEWNVRDVYNWTVELVEKYPELKNNIHPIDIVYEGTLANLYPNLSLTDHWHENVLEAMKVDKEHFGMEENESLCRNRTPREGIVLRINDDPVNEAFKLKCIAFLSKEAKMIDAGEVDIELSQGRYDSEDSEENNE